ncbi:MAG TPA: hypothetical protein VLB01_04940 [Thermodesulfobacteriota bacterium]|nr:hypothetical protein [Thermodesulfobacteriota bacterium]
MKLLKRLKIGITALVLFVGITAVFSLPSMVRCGGEIDPQDSTSIVDLI